MKIEQATSKDLPEIMELQLRAFRSVAEELDWKDAPNMHETLDHAREEFPHYTTLKLTSDDGVLVGSVQGEVEDG